MYNAYFGFREKPFKLVPNPDYLFLSKSHEVALAHLAYATDQGDGFVVITGEVGTGKTTLCRIFLERLDGETESAYIFNPKLDSTQLLTSICNEFGIQTRYSSVKGLLDQINSYLIAMNKEGRHVILLIDEAQNLTIENLEMVRMLSNLETTRSKLLQIILVGQPELTDKLDSYELRQLSQRISLNCHLTPLSAKETEGYIHHRINIAAQRNMDLFASGACRKIHQYSGGIPRLINIGCDRALLSTFSLNRKKVSPAIAGSAIKELRNRGHEKDADHWRKLFWIALACLFLLILGIWVAKSELFAKGQAPSVSSVKQKSERPVPESEQPVTESEHDQDGQVYKIAPVPQSDNPLKTKSAGGNPDESAVPADKTVRSETHVIDKRLAAAIRQMDPNRSRLDAVAALLALWQQPRPHAEQLPRDLSDLDFFDIIARQYGLRVHLVEGNWPLIKQLNLPCILAVKTEKQNPPVYLTLAQWKDGQMFLSGGAGKETIQTDFKKIKPHLHGNVYLFWKNITGFDFIIAHGADSQAVIMVKSLLQRVGYGSLNEGPAYDSATRQAVLEFQRRHKIKADGLVGPVTKILLINAAKAYNVPFLHPDGEAGV
jgi:general secretion pathway protein A